VVSCNYMPYKELKLYWRAWINRSFKPRVEKCARKKNMTKIALVNEAVDKYLERAGF